VAAIVGAALALIVLLVAPTVGEAQQGKMVRVGYLSPLTEKADTVRREAFLQGLRDLGYVEGRNVVVDRRFADGHLERLQDLAVELVRLEPAVIIAAGGGQIALAARRVTTTVPIVMTNVEDPVVSGLAMSLSRPGGNVTGLTALVRDLSAKRLELLKQIRPGITRVAVLWNGAYPEKTIEFEETQTAARALLIQIQPLRILQASEIDAALDNAVKARADALIMLPDPLTNTSGKRIIELAMKRRLPTMFTQRPPVDEGGLISYGPSYPDLFRRAAGYVDRIVKGAKPAELPIEQPNKFELVINLKTAKAIGLSISQALLARADHLIE
jgi:putative ABC transport system substrate-binding protein